jgi:predicted phosphodiesterase
MVEWNGFNLPEPEKNDYSKVLISEKRIGILSDIHFPYYDKIALTAATNHLIEFKPDCIVLNGDIIDCYQLSNFEKDPRQRSFKYELDILRNFIIQLRDLFPNSKVIFKLGNHEERYERVILSRVPELIDLELFSFASVITAKDLGIEVITNKRLMKAGHLNIGHGHEFAKGFLQSVNPARGFYLRAKNNFIGGHHHRTSEHVEQDINGKIIAAWSMGCLSELNPHYMPINSWNHGFATVETDGDEFALKNLKIIKGKVV